MISGFNTDVESGGVVYHIQTEDKGRKSRLIVSLVYDRGTILASKRTTYGDLDNGSFDENVLAEKVQRQHKLICAAIKAGRITELVEMGDGGKKKPKSKPSSPEVPAYMPAIEMPYAQFPAAVAEAETIATVLPANLKLTKEDLVFEDARIVEEDSILSSEAVNVVSELSGTERPKHAKLSVELLGDTKFKGGDRRDVHIMVCRGTDRKVVRDAQVMIKILGSSFRPMIFHAKTDANGLAKVHLQLPHFHAGRAALLLRAMSDGEEIEFRRIITPG